MDDVEIITRQTEAMSWESLPTCLSLDMASIKDFSSRVLISKLVGIKPLGKALIIGLIRAMWKFAVGLKIEVMENSTFLFHFSCSQDRAHILNLAS